MNNNFLMSWLSDEAFPMAKCERIERPSGRKLNPEVKQEI